MATTAIAVVVALIILAGGSYALYKATRTNDETTPATTTAQRVFSLWQNGDRNAASESMTPVALKDLFAIKATESKGLAFKGCKKTTAAFFPKLCVWSRPGGQLSMQLIVEDKKNLIDAVSYGTNALPPAGDATPAG